MTPRAGGATLEAIGALERQLCALRRTFAQGGAAPMPAPTERVGVLRFWLAQEAYGIPIEAIQEVVRYVRLSSVSGAPRSVLGLMDLRGTAVPVVDLRVRMGAPAPAPGLSTPIVVTRGEAPLAIVVDRVRDIVEVPGASIEPADRSVALSRSVVALAHHEAELLQLVDPARLLTTEELADVFAQAEVA